ncbi:deoxyribodipyrimidine photo-lyase [Nitrosomonas sp. sh817]|uniref:cryptochrome/photolyase family protein n=1 Tax=Nitrosomonas sp. sh817 TaxID=3070658 RepID=UPI0027DAFBBE|nr:deoxyribodipyrimidine photo-lyase [Nitrosomonas sp. sh817]WMJ08161.1 deoxyribodipyrimidine photo-lyase [Nitrosomonas sp. sh817]
MTTPLAVFWFRRDLRLHDNAGLAQALASGHAVLPVFIFDSNILSGLPQDDARVTFIFDTLQALRTQLERDHGSSLALYHGKPLEVFERILHSYPVAAVYTNHDYEPYARERDDALRQWLKTQSVTFHSFKDQVVFEKREVVKEDGDPYVVYTPYMRKWRSMLSQIALTVYPSAERLSGLVKQLSCSNLTLADIGFVRAAITVPPYQLGIGILEYYAADRDFPARQGTSQLSPHLRFGTVSIRQIVQQTLEISDSFCNELIWREFFSQILWHFPQTVHKSFKPQYDRIQWRNDATEFQRWCEGTTGYPLVDAGMRQLNATGLMHNRIRMVTASFLCKHLLIDWRWGEAYFARKLLDYDLASNVGNWQWVGGCGVDAAPYFRIFNPTTQIEKFDQQFDYIQTWVHDWHTLSYPAPMVDHAAARTRCLHAYREAVS